MAKINDFGQILSILARPLRMSLVRSFCSKFLMSQEQLKLEEKKLTQKEQMDTKIESGGEGTVRLSQTGQSSSVALHQNLIRTSKSGI